MLIIGCSHYIERKGRVYLPNTINTSPVHGDINGETEEKQTQNNNEIPQSMDPNEFLFYRNIIILDINKLEKKSRPSMR